MALVEFAYTSQSFGAMVKSTSPDSLKKELGATSATSEETLDLEGKELLTYFANLFEEDCKGILHHLRDNEQDRQTLDML